MDCSVRHCRTNTRTSGSSNDSPFSKLGQVLSRSKEGLVKVRKGSEGQVEANEANEVYGDNFEGWSFHDEPAKQIWIVCK